MALALPAWPEEEFCDHGLVGPVDVFIDESGPRPDRTLVLGVLVVQTTLAGAARNYLDWVASKLEVDHPALKSSAYGGEWKGRVLARSTASTKERRAVGRGELLSDLARQSVYARCLDAIRVSPGSRALALSYRWTGTTHGPSGQAGYRVRRCIQAALSALEFQGLDLRHAYIDDGHAAHYSAGIREYAEVTGRTPIPHEFVDSVSDRRIQIADLIAFAAHTSRFPGGSRVFASAHSWLTGFVADRLITLGAAPDHHVVEP